LFFYAGYQGRFSNLVIDEIILDFMILEVEKGYCNFSQSYLP
jgi:hypothetical protein